MRRKLAWTTTVLAVALLAGCGGGSSSSDTGDVGQADLPDPHDAETVTAGDDAPGESEPADLDFGATVAVSEVIPTVATVTWTVESTPVDETWVEFGPDSAYGMTAPGNPNNAPLYETILLGMKPGRDYHFRVVVRYGDAILTGPDRVLKTGAVPGKLPSAKVALENPDHHAAGFIVTTVLASPPSAVILDSEGDYVWWYVPDVDEDFKAGRARLSHDGRSILFWGVNVRKTEPTPSNQSLFRVSLDGTQVEKTPLPEGHHDFVELPDGTIAFIEFDPRQIKDKPVDGDRVVELRPDGSRVDVYSVWDDFEYSGIAGPAGRGWCHANYLVYEAGEDAYYMGSRTWSSILRIDRSTGTLLGVVGGHEGDYVLTSGGTTPFVEQHGFDVVEGGLLVFDNGGKDQLSSRAVEHALDHDAMTMSQAWSYEPQPHLYVVTHGDIQRLPNGNTLVNFSNSGQFDEVDPGGNLVWRLNMSLGGALGYSTWMESLYE